MGNTKNTIKIKSYSNIVEEMAATAAAIKPGMILEMGSASNATVCKAHATANGNVVPMIALEDELQGKSIYDAYSATAGTKIQVWIPTRGDIAYLIPVDGTALAIGDFVTSNGDGRVKKYVVTVDSAADVETIYDRIIIGQVLETITSASESAGEEEEMVMVRIL